nr:inovirus-type Gp2 protein [Pseudomaricurvus alkylphenolicus]
MLKPIKNQLDAMLSHYAKVLMVRLDIRVAEYSGKNEKISRLMNRIKKLLNGKKYDMKTYGYVWVREKEEAAQQHYHLALLLNGHKVRHPGSIISWIEQYLEIRDEPKPFTPKNCYLMIHRGDLEEYKEAFHRLSYFAKERGKGQKDKTANNFSTSRVKPNKESLNQLKEQLIEQASLNRVPSLKSNAVKPAIGQQEPTSCREQVWEAPSMAVPATRAVISGNDLSIAKDLHDFPNDLGKTTWVE